MKKFILSISAICTIIGVVLAVHAQKHDLSGNMMFEHNVEALSNDESISVPCVCADGVCFTGAYDAFGNFIFLPIEGMKYRH